MNSGVYSIRNVRNKKQYVGSTINFKKRWEYHKCCLENDCHENPYLQNAWNKPNSKFVFVILELVNPPLLITAEQKWIDKLRPKLYNLNLIANKPPGFKGRVHSLKTIEKMRAAKLGKRHKHESIEKMRLAKLGKKASPETKRKLSVGRKGKYTGTKHSMWRGYWVTPFGVFDTCKTAAQTLNVSNTTIKKLCRR